MQKTLTQIAKELVTQGGLRNPTYDTLTDYQRDKLIEIALQHQTVKTVNSIVIREINDALDDAIIGLAMMRQFYDESCIDAQNFIDEDNAQRARDINKEIRGI